MGRLDGKVALVTGAARGTGALTARLFAAEGAHVVLADVLDEAGAAVAREIGAAAHFIHLDVTTEPHWERAVAETALRFGRIDVLVNNAAVLHMSAIADTSPEDFLRVVRVNQLGTFLGIKAAIEPMKAAGGGSIVNVASVDGLRGQNGVVAYASSKWAVRGITRVAALELGRYGIRVNTVCPEAGSAFMVAPYMPPGVPVEKIIPRMQPTLSYQKDRTLEALMQDVANAILFLASDESRSCTGSDLVCEGGNTAGRIVKGAPGATT
ncbi:MAG: 3-alpha-hydroxysteroid dehydrogenase [Deltaproteobacteria bacterium]|nr:3-alpha-hydroxysteroid dehydrogenase [Deltaproteobacteria bacterium]